MAKELEVFNPLEEGDPSGHEAITMEEAANVLYGAQPGQEVPRVVAKGVDIFTIWPDLTQPRRAIPARIRNDWDGDPVDVRDILFFWGSQVWDIAESKEILLPPLEDVLHGRFEWLEMETDNPLVDDYNELIRLAASIQREGLINPITVSPHPLTPSPSGRGGNYMIETGERRWLAYHLLSQYVDGKKYGKIPAIEKSKADVWRQAAENGARKPLNAIGMARQLALLIMDMYQGRDGGAFDSYETLVFGGECDRRFYAQVENGHVYPVLPGMMQRVLDVTGLKSRTQVSQYRRLLEIADTLWMEADEGNWTEGRIREEIALTPDPSPSGRGEKAEKVLTVVNTETPPNLTPGPSPTGEGSRELPPGVTMEYIGTYDAGNLAEGLAKVFEEATQPHPPAPSPLRREGENAGSAEEREPVSVEMKMVDVLAALQSLAAIAEYEPETYRYLMRLNRAEIRRMVEEDEGGYLTAIDGLYDTVVMMLQGVAGRVHEFTQRLKEIGWEME